MFRPAKLGRDPKYGPSDAGHEYVPGVTETFLGPLAQRLGIEGTRATLDARTNLYVGRTPDDSRPLHDRPVSTRYRPVFGGNVHAPKTLAVWMAALPAAEKRRAEALFFKCCAEVTAERMLGQFTSRRGAGGRGTPDPAEVMFVGFKHLTDSAGQYRPHYLIEVHNVGRTPSGRVKCVDGKVLFDKQELFSVEFATRVMTEFHRAFGLVMRPVGRSLLEVKGLEGLRGVRTPRQAEIDAELARRGLDDTPRNRDAAARNTHRPRDLKLTVQQAVAATRAWAHAHGVNGRAAYREAKGRVSDWYMDRMAEKAIRWAVKGMNALGEPVGRYGFTVLLLRGVLRYGADPVRVRGVVTRGDNQARRYGVIPLAGELLSTTRIERSRHRAWRAYCRLERKHGVPPSDRVLSKLAVDGVLGVRVDGAAVAPRRAVTVQEPDETTRVLMNAYRADGRRVHTVASLTRQEETGAELRTGTTPPEAYAARLGRTRVWEAFKEMRRHRWRSAAHVESLWHEARKPKLALNRSDVLVLDTRDANLHALAAIVTHARKAGATVITIGSLELPPEARGINRWRGTSPDRT